MNPIRHNWTVEQAQKIYDLPFNDLLFEAQTMHRQYHDPNKVQLSRILSIKTGACPEDCKYCGQSARYHKKTGIEVERLMAVEKVVEAAKRAKAQGASRFCMGGAWRDAKDGNFNQLLEMVTAVKEVGLETCLTVGMLSQEEVDQLDEVGLDYYKS